MVSKTFIKELELLVYVKSCTYAIDFPLGILSVFVIKKSIRRKNLPSLAQHRPTSGRASIGHSFFTQMYTCVTNKMAAFSE